jgi:hypothetical protein
MTDKMKNKNTTLLEEFQNHRYLIERGKLDTPSTHDSPAWYGLFNKKWRD